MIDYRTDRSWSQYFGDVSRGYRDVWSKDTKAASVITAWFVAVNPAMAYVDWGVDEYANLYARALSGEQDAIFATGIIGFLNSFVVLMNTVSVNDLSRRGAQIRCEKQLGELPRTFE